MPEQSFRLGINMAGAVSAGAYTAGVFDFLVEALDAWQTSKNNHEPVPMHKASIEVLSGASAGGMCAAIATAALFDDPARKQTKFYQAWVKSIDIKSLISQTDLDSGPLRSLLNSDILDGIAAETISLPAPRRREFVSPNLNLFLTLTSTRGMPYGVDFAADAAFEEHTNYYAEQVRFEVTDGSGDPLHVSERYHLRLNDQGGASWTRLKTAAIATGAVPLMLAPKRLDRDPGDYSDRMWQVSNPDPCRKPDETTPPSSEQCNCWCDQAVKIEPAWEKPNAPVQNVYVDGGMTNNNPFECARLFLARQTGELHNQRSPLLADAAVITIAPFPGADSFSPSWSADQHATLLGTLKSLKSILVTQSRFTGEGLSLLKDPDVASRFVIAPDDDLVPVPALQCGSLGAFGGFLSEKFRDRDYRLGRRNCQKFLQRWFVLPYENPLIQDGLGHNPDNLIRNFQSTQDDRPFKSRAWMPIIPLCTDALRTPIPHPGREQIDAKQLDRILVDASSRLARILRKVSPPGLVAFGTAIFGGITADYLVSLARPVILKDLKRSKGLAENAR